MKENTNGNINIFKYTNKYKKIIFFAIIFSIVEFSITMITPFFLKRIIDDGIIQKNINVVLINSSLALLITCILAIPAIYAPYLSAKIAYMMQYDMQKDIFKKIQSFSFANLDKFSPDTILTRITNDTAKVCMATVHAFTYMFSTPVLFLFSLILAISISPKLSLIFVIMMPLLICIIVVLAKSINPKVKKIQKRIDIINKVIRENVNGIRTIKTYTQEDLEKEKFEDANSNLKKSILSFVVLVILILPIITIFSNTTYILLQYFGGNMVLDQRLTVGQLVQFMLYTTSSFIGLILFSITAVNVFPAFVSMNRINEILNTEIDIKESRNAVEEIKGNLDIEFSNVSFKYPKLECNTLENISFKIPFGSSLGIVGPTGSGKSTILSLLLRLYDVSSGKISISGVDIREIDLELLNQMFSFVLQESKLFTGTLRENLTSGRANITDDDIFKVLKIAQIYPLVKSFEDGLNHEVLVDGANFSGGQKQRLSIARALLKNSPIIVFDDSTSALDRITEAKIKEAIDNLEGQKTKIIVSQRISSVMACDQIIVIEDGKITAIGKHDDLIKTSELYKEIYHSQGDENANS